MAKEMTKKANKEKKTDNNPHDSFSNSFKKMIVTTPNRSAFPKVEYGVMSPAQEQLEIKKEFSKTVRTDYAKRVDLRIPQGYHSQVKKTWEMYISDRLFRYLVDRCIDFGANGFEWEVPIKVPRLSSLFARKKRNNIIEKAVKEKQFWDTWSASLNQTMPNVLPGIDEPNKWMFKHLLLNSMAVPDWEWGTKKVGDTEYQVPVRMVVQNPLHVALVRKGDRFIDEQMYLLVKKDKKRMSEIDTSQVQTAYPDYMANNYQEMKILGMGKDEKQEAFAIKYNWSPGDNSIQITGSFASVGQGLYPTPSFIGLHQFIILRRSLIAADLSILDGIINFLLWWEVGDNTAIKGIDGEDIMVNQPKPKRKLASGIEEDSTITQISKMITTETLGKVMQVFLPYYVKPHILIPDTESLINAEKYAQSSLELLSAFGILIAPKGNKLEIGDLNIANFEEMLEGIRQRHIKRFWEMLAGEIVKRNKGKLSAIPNMVWNPLNTQDQDFRAGLFALAKLGWLSKESILNAYRKDVDVEATRSVNEINRDIVDLFERNIPTEFKQSAVGKTGKVTESSRTAFEEGGRPRKE